MSVPTKVDSQKACNMRGAVVRYWIVYGDGQ